MRFFDLTFKIKPGKNRATNGFLKIVSYLMALTDDDVKSILHSWGFGDILLCVDKSSFVIPSLLERRDHYYTKATSLLCHESSIRLF